MSEGRSRCSLGVLFEIENGFAFKSADFQAAGVPVIKIKNIKANHFAEGEHSFVSSRFTKERPNKVARRGDLLISMSGNRHDGSPETWVGKVAPFNHVGTFLINQRVGALRPKPHAALSTRYFGYLLSSWSFQEHFIAVATSSGGQANLSPSQILAVPVEYPTLPEQRAIASTLGALDDKIELNRKMNATLEAMARALFRDWFVDFGPTRAKMEARAPTLSPDLWSLFPDRLDEEGKPEGWEVGMLGAVATAKNEGVDPSAINPDTPYIGLEHMPRGSIALNDWEGAGKVSSNKAAFATGDFLFGKLRPYFHKVGVAPISGICSTDIVVVRPKAAAWAGFVIACISDDDFVAYTDNTSTGTKMPRTSWTIMARYRLNLPSKQLAEAYNAVVTPMLERIRANIKETRTIAQTRDLLLPRLMSGELRVADLDPSELETAT